MERQIIRKVVKEPVREGDLRNNPITGVTETYNPEGKWVPVYKGIPWTPPPTENKTNRALEWGFGSPYKKKKVKKLIRYKGN